MPTRGVRGELSEWGARAVAHGSRLPASTAGLLIGVTLALSWVSTSAFGGTASVPPHAFYVPIMIAGLRFGAAGALGASLASTLLAGPMSYAEVASRTPQPLSDWAVRGVFFVLVGQALTAMVGLRTAGLHAELEDLRATRRLWAALDGDRFSLRYQPIVSLRRGGRVVGAEALVRLEEPDGVTVGPDQFVPEAERTGMIRAIGAWVLLEACRQCARWRDEGLLEEGFRLHVNVSPLELDSATFVEQVQDTLRASDLDPGMLCIEITEHAIAQDSERFLDTLHQLHRLGVSLALDDYGTGHAGLGQLQRLPVDVVKVDQSFVTGLDERRDRAVITQHVTSLARSLGLVTIAEGVERAQEAAAVERLGCDLVQGYHFGRPMGADQFTLALAAEGAGARDGATPGAPATAPGAPG